MKKLFLLLFITIVLYLNLSAEYTQICSIKYKTSNGWSKYYSIEVKFISGFELNNATNSFDYDGFSIYAIAFWSQNEATIIKISSFTGCSQTVNQGCITNNVTNLVGSDKQGKKWELCTKSNCF